MDAIKEVERLVRKAHEKGFIIHLPTDHCIAETLDEHATVGVTDDDQGGLFRDRIYFLFIFLICINLFGYIYYYYSSSDLDDHVMFIQR